MKNCFAKRRIFISIACIVIGITLNVICALGHIDEYWSGFGVGLAVVGILQIIRNIRYRKNSEYKEKVDTELNDERNKYLANKAWAWSGYTFVIASAIASIVLMILGYKDYALICSYALCFIVFVYYIFHLILSRKY